jgi:hypothetical protein
MADCTKSLISLSDFDRWFALDFDRWLALVQTAVVHHSPTDGSQHPKTADQQSLMQLEQQGQLLHLEEAKHLEPKGHLFGAVRLESLSRFAKEHLPEQQTPL